MPLVLHSLGVQDAESTFVASNFSVHPGKAELEGTDAFETNASGPISTPSLITSVDETMLNQQNDSPGFEDRSAVGVRDDCQSDEASDPQTIPQSVKDNGSRVL